MQVNLRFWKDSATARQTLVSVVLATVLAACGGGGGGSDPGDVIDIIQPEELPNIQLVLVDEDTGRVVSNVRVLARPRDRKYAYYCPAPAQVDPNRGVKTKCHPTRRCLWAAKENAQSYPQLVRKDQNRIACS